MTTFELTPPEPVDGRAAASLGRLGPAVQWLAATQGSWPAQAPRSVRRLVLDDTGETATAFDEGISLADEIADAGADLVVLSTTAEQSPGVVAIAALLDLEPVHAVGTASGADWAALTVAVRDGLRHARRHTRNPSTLLTELGSPALARATGVLAQSAVRRTGVVLDGSPLVCAAALLAGRLAPGAQVWWLAGQVPPNPAAARALAELSLVGLLDLSLALPAGGDLALSVLEQAVALP